MEEEEESMLLSNGLQCLHQFLETMMMNMKSMTTSATTSPDDFQSDLNRLLLPGMQVYVNLSQRFIKNCKKCDEVIQSEVKAQFFRVWCVLLDCVKQAQAQGEKECTESKVITGCDLSSDDFYMLCDPELKSVEVCLKEVRELLQRVKHDLPFDSDAFRSQENLFESLFILLVCWKNGKKSVFLTNNSLEK